MHNGNKHVHIDSLGRNVLGHDARSSIGKCIIDDMAFGVAVQPSWKFGGDLVPNHLDFEETVGSKSKQHMITNISE